MQIDIGEGILHDLKKILGRKYIFLLHLNEFNLNNGFEITQLLKLFMHLQMTKRYGRLKKKKKYTIQYAILTLLLHYSL